MFTIGSSTYTNRLNFCVQFSGSKQIIKHTLIDLVITDLYSIKSGFPDTYTY